MIYAVAVSDPTSTWSTPGRRRQTEAKRAAIMDAAEELFVTSGYELTSVDAIAARASVSKRTVYDHFGNKRSLFRSVVGRVDDAILQTMHAAVHEELADDRDLRDALLGFIRRLTTDVLPSSTYATFRHLLSRSGGAPPLPERSAEEPEKILEGRFARLAADGRLTVPDPRRAVQHFLAMTMGLILETLDNSPSPAEAEPEIQAITADGVDAFLRAYR